MLENLKVNNIIISKQGEKTENYKKFKEIVKKKKIRVLVVNKGERVQIEKNIYFDILWPDNNSLIKENTINNNSIVCKLEYKKFSMLFAGDIEEETEELILNKNINFKSDILKIAHHRFKNVYK